MSKNVHEINGKGIWKFIPRPYRYWWVFLAQRFSPDIYYEDIIIEDQLTKFIDSTSEVLNWDRCIET